MSNYPCSDTVTSTMRIFILQAALFLGGLSWMSESHTVEVKSGKDVTLMCPNMSTSPTQTEWLRVVNGTKSSCISGMYGAGGEASFCDGLQKTKFEMSSNVTTIFLKIKHVDLSDTGLYFCGFYINAHIKIGNPTELSIQGSDESDIEVCPPCMISVIPYPLIVICGSLTVFFMLAVIGLAIKLGQRHAAANEERNPERNKNLGSCDLNSAALMIPPRTMRNRKPALEREAETRVIYTASI